MSEQAPFAFGKLIPGFEFLQQLTAGNAGGAAATGLGHWVAPTVNVEELEQRIAELKTVQFWLEQNLLALKATVQALEVQKMTLLTLRGMNLSMAEVAQAFTMPSAAPPAPAPMPEGGSGWPYPDKGAGAAAAAPAPEPAEPDEPKAAAPAKAPRRPAAANPLAAAPASAGGTDPLQWWGALTQQFQQIATQTLREAARAMPAAEPTDLAPAGAPADASKPPAAARKAATAKRKKAARKTPAKKSAAKAPAPRARSLPGWLLPTPPDKS